MLFDKFYIENNNGKRNCVIRSFCKLFDKEYDQIYNELCGIQKELNSSSYNDIEVFEEYMKKFNTNKIEYGNDIKIKDLFLDNGSYIIFCWDKKEFYHMVTIIDNVLYDKDDKSLELYTISIYKKNTNN
jgi:hypothetical protein